MSHYDIVMELEEVCDKWCKAFCDQRGELKALEASHARLLAWAGEVMAEFPHHETEGMLEIGLKHGVLKAVEVTEPCSTDCICYETDNIPGTCYRAALAEEGE